MMCFAAERSAQKHADYIMCIGLYARNQLVFVDESAMDQHMTYRGHRMGYLGAMFPTQGFFCLWKAVSMCFICHLIV